MWVNNSQPPGSVEAYLVAPGSPAFDEKTGELGISYHIYTIPEHGKTASDDLTIPLDIVTKALALSSVQQSHAMSSETLIKLSGCEFASDEIDDWRAQHVINLANSLHHGRQLDEKGYRRVDRVSFAHPLAMSQCLSRLGHGEQFSGELTCKKVIYRAPSWAVCQTDDAVANDVCTETPTLQVETSDENGMSRATSCILDIENDQEGRNASVNGEESAGSEGQEEDYGTSIVDPSEGKCIALRLRPVRQRKEPSRYGF